MQTFLSIFSENSVLKRLPINIGKKQLVFLDGIRHSIEVVEVAYNRLLKCLTEVANDPPSGNELSLIIPYVFIDVWVIVDALDKFRNLYQNFPGMKYSQSPEVVPLAELMESFRQIRNVQDHLYSSAQKVAANGEGAFGMLEWMTLFADPVPSCWKCVIRPGTIDRFIDTKVDSMTTTFNEITDNVTLKIAGHTGNISSIIPQLKLRIENIEKAVQKSISVNNIGDFPVASDFFSRQGFVLSSKALD